MNKKLLGFAIITLVVFTLVFSASALGDDVDYGGGSDWDSGSDWSSDSDWGDSSYTYYSDNDSSSGGSVSPITVAIIIFVIIFLSTRRKKRFIVTPTAHNTTNTATRAKYVDVASLDKLRKLDAYFSTADIEAHVKCWVIEFEKEWCNGDMTPCRDAISESLFKTYQSQLSAMRAKNERSCTHDLAVLACEVERWVEDGRNEYLDVWFKCKKRTFKVDYNNSSRVVTGNPNTVYHLEYRWQLVRTPLESDNSDGTTCPHCGGKYSVRDQDNCVYCGSILPKHKGNYTKWVLNKVDKLSQY